MHPHRAAAPNPEEETRSLRTWRLRITWIHLVLLLLFGFRVAAQFLQGYRPVNFLPEFDAWHSGLLPYGLLFAIQLVLGVGGLFVTWRVGIGRIRPDARFGFLLLSLGSLYFAAMLFRLGLASCPGAAARGFAGQWLPAAFHLVFASWLILIGFFHDAGSRSAGNRGLAPVATLVHWLAYPVLIASGLLLHLLLLRAGVALAWSTYAPVLIGAVIVTLLERNFPHRRAWQPDRSDVAGDLQFMVFVQILLPKFLAFLVAITALRFLHEHEIILDGLWPHHLPPIVQAALMLLAADFLRYWLHRASHEWSPLLWRFHAVHHSPPKLYWVNVGRFHPLEKSLQFLCDAAPFIVLGVSGEVLALYFVFYSLNGICQHCNIELRLGLLNYVISGPELHRWHHSRETRESNKNYGNNVIVWDLLFGSYFLPRDYEVAELGLRNRAYPLDFLRQMRTPFVKGLDRETR